MEGDEGGQVGAGTGQLQNRPAAETEADRGQLPAVQRDAAGL